MVSEPIVNMITLKKLKPLWYIEYETLVTILKTINKLDRDLKEKIIQIIARFEKRIEETNYSFNEYVLNEMNTSDYYWSE